MQTHTSRNRLVVGNKCPRYKAREEPVVYGNEPKEEHFKISKSEWDFKKLFLFVILSIIVIVFLVLFFFK